MLEKTIGQGKSSSIADAISAVAVLDYQTLKVVSNKDERASDLELKVESKGDLDSENEFSLNISHSVGYTNNTGGYDNSFSYDLNANNDRVYESDENVSVSDVSRESLTVPEAEVTVKDVQYATAFGTQSELDHRERRKLSHFAMFEPALLRMFEALHGVTRDVNYSYN